MRYPISDTIITAVMNRSERLYDGVQNWLQSTNVKQVIVVDWSSVEPIDYQRLHEMPGNVVLIRVESQPHWHLTKAFNLAARFASMPLICKMDVDYRISPDFLEEPVKRGTFWRGSDKIISHPQERFLSGFVRLWASDFNEIHGYNERIVGYGYDDDDFSNRLKSLNLIEETKFHGKIQHLEHERFLESANLENKKRSETILSNRAVAISQPWSKKDRHAVYDLEKISKRHYIAIEKAL